MKKAFLLFTFSVLLFPFLQHDALAAPIAAPEVQSQDPNTMSVLWFQTSGEAKALYYQGYSIGKMRLDQILVKRTKSKGLKPAIVLDIDETVLDNSPCLALNAQTGKAFPANWNKWVNHAHAEALPGAIDFLKYARSKGVEIYYISNRNESQKKATVQNLRRVGAPMAVPKHVLLQQQDEKGKELRRKQVARKYDIVLLFGDNLGDFSGFDQLTPSQRILTVDKYKKEFGKKLIVFPNPMYGDWEAAIYNYDYSKTDFEKAKLRKESMHPFQP
jgi:5'-nucleotidase (lipoprotein e(P4) family)